MKKPLFFLFILLLLETITTAFSPTASQEVKGILRSSFQRNNQHNAQKKRGQGGTLLMTELKDPKKGNEDFGFRKKEANDAQLGVTKAASANKRMAAAAFAVPGWMKVLPSPPYIVAGALGGPIVMYLVTPLRNALTLGTLDPTASALSLYGEVFGKQPFAGGVPMAKAAVPGFLVLGPAYHMYKSLVQSSLVAVILTAVSESLIFYGAETNNAQVAFNNNNNNNNEGDATDKKIQTLHNPLNPFGGIGLALHIGRNILAMSGLRVLSTPFQKMLSRYLSSPVTAGLVGELGANLLVSALSAPLHQLYGWCVTTRKLNNEESFAKAAIAFLKSQYLTESGSISSVAGRDMSLRCAYNATIFTLYGFLERMTVKYWPASLLLW